LIPYNHQNIDQDDIKAVAETLRSDFLTTGPKVEEFEKAFAAKIGSEYTLAVSSGTAALHCAMAAIEIGVGDEVITPAITFVASANCVAYMGAVPVFADVAADTLLIDLEDIERKITAKTKAVIAVDFAGQPCNYLGLRQLADKHNLWLIDDACHSLGADYLKIPHAFWGHINCFSFHPVKSITTGEGGMVSFEHSDAEALYERAKQFRNHGRSERGMETLGFNYRLSDISCALGINQLKRLDHFIDKRSKIANRYNDAFSQVTGVTPLTQLGGCKSSHHLYVIRCKKRNKLRQHLKNKGIGSQVHYRALTLEPYYHNPGSCLISEKVCKEVLSIPIYPGLTNKQVDYIIEVIVDYAS